MTLKKLFVSLTIALATFPICKTLEHGALAESSTRFLAADAPETKDLIGMWKTISFKVDGKVPSDAKKPPIVFRKDGTCLWGGSTGEKYEWTYDRDIKELVLSKRILGIKTTAISAKVEFEKGNLLLKWYAAEMNCELLLAPDK